ncbi:MAG: hypothetical protein WDO24_08730 [Pseudomonadota bacterium]
MIDLQGAHPHAIDKVVVDEAPEGIAISPKGDLIAAILLNGSAGIAKDAWFARPKGKIALFRVNGTKLTKAGEIMVGKLPEGAAFQPRRQISLCRQLRRARARDPQGRRRQVTDTHKNLKLPGAPASIRSSSE